jgi:hypothetical protein
LSVGRGAALSVGRGVLRRCIEWGRPRCAPAHRAAARPRWHAAPPRAPPWPAPVPAPPRPRRHPTPPPRTPAPPLPPTRRRTPQSPCVRACVRAWVTAVCLSSRHSVGKTRHWQKGGGKKALNRNVGAKKALGKRGVGRCRSQRAGLIQVDGGEGLLHTLGAELGRQPFHQHRELAELDLARACGAGAPPATNPFVNLPARASLQGTPLGAIPSASGAGHEESNGRPHPSRGELRYAGVTRCDA